MHNLVQSILTSRLQDDKRLPSGSTCFAICKASEVARSVLAGVTANIRHVSFVINWNNMSLICCSISTG